MKILQINGGVFGSTGKIMFGIMDKAISEGMECMCMSPVASTNRNRAPDHEYVKIGTYHSRRLSVFMGRVTGRHGCFAERDTAAMLKVIDEYNPDIIHLHNLHDSYINLKKLFDYIKSHNIRVVWTLHDCWAFTGHCVHFTMVKCTQWKTHCTRCVQYKQYPFSYFRDVSSQNFDMKKSIFTGVQDMTIVTPSQWLANLVKESFLQNYPVQVINNGIDLSVFKPTESNFRQKHKIGNRYMLLGVAFGWGFRKGLDVFLELSKRLDNAKYQIVLVGTDDKIDKQLPENIISIHRTQNQQELAEIYTAADLFVNPTREDNYPTVNMEAIACGTPVLTFRTGGSPEILDETCGAVVDCGDVDGMEQEIIRISKTSMFRSEDCLKKAANFDMNKKFAEYMNIYKSFVPNNMKGCRKL